jgi:hypothetical protein
MFHSHRYLIPNILSDQEEIWTFPARLVQGQNWIPTAAILGTTAGVIALDPTEAPISATPQHFMD